MRAHHPVSAAHEEQLTHPRPSHDHGSATLEIVVLFPALMLLIFGLIQGALWFHARNIALAAANDALTAARSEQGTASAGQDAATSFIARTGGDSVLPGAYVTVTRTGTRVTVTVTGRALSVFPGVPGAAVSQSVNGPVEHFTSAGNP